MGYDGWIKGTLKAIGSGLKWVVKQVLGTKFPTNILDPTPIGLDRHEEIRDSLSNRADSLDQLANEIMLGNYDSDSARVEAIEQFEKINEEYHTTVDACSTVTPGGGF